MLNHTIALEDPIQGRKRTPAVDHVIFRNDLKPVHNRLLFEDVAVVRDPEANPDPVILEAVESICRHQC